MHAPAAQRANPTPSDPTRTYVNSCWELYGAEDRAHYPSSGHAIEMDVSVDKPNLFNWFTGWNTRGGATCPGSPNSTITEHHNDTAQEVVWDIHWPSSK